MGKLKAFKNKFNTWVYVWMQNWLEERTGFTDYMNNKNAQFLLEELNKMSEEKVDMLFDKLANDMENTQTKALLEGVKLQYQAEKSLRDELIKILKRKEGESKYALLSGKQS